MNIVPASQMTPFIFEQHSVRLIMRDGDPWFIAADVCEALGLSNPSMSLSSLDDDEKAKLNLGLSGGQTNVISEPGLFTLVLRCREAITPGTLPYRFRKWVTTQVLPSIRKTGDYQATPTLPDFTNPADAARAWAAEYDRAQIATEKVLCLEDQNAKLLPKAQAHDRLSAAQGDLCFTDAAKTLKIGPKNLIETLKKWGWIYKRKRDGDWVGAQSKIDARYLEHTPVTYPSASQQGVLRAKTQCRVTQKGIAKIAELLGQKGFLQ